MIIFFCLMFYSFLRCVYFLGWFLIPYLLYIRRFHDTFFLLQFRSLHWLSVAVSCRFKALTFRAPQQSGTMSHRRASVLPVFQWRREAGLFIYLYILMAWTQGSSKAVRKQQLNQKSAVLTRIKWTDHLFT